MFPAPAFCVPVGLRVSCENPSSFAQTQPLSMAAGGSQSPRRRRPPRPTKQTSQFERSVDDLVGKRMGRGYIYYGERTGGRAGEEADAAAAEAAAAAAEAGEESDDGFLKDDAIVVAGGCGRTGQWITLGLVNQGFNVRVLTRVFERAEKLFGPSGSNVDVFEGDVGAADTLADALDGAAGLVIASSPEWWRPWGGGAVEERGAIALVNAAAKSGTVRRIVFLSRAAAGGGSRERAAQSGRVEQVLQTCGVPYVVVRIPKLSNAQGGMSNILLKQGEDAGSKGGPDGSIGSLTRVDAAQVVCQAFVHDRFMNEMDATDPGSFIFGDVILEASNGSQPSIISKRYWKNAFSRLREEGEEKAIQFDAERDAEEVKAPEEY